MAAAQRRLVACSEHYRVIKAGSDAFPLPENLPVLCSPYQWKALVLCTQCTPLQPIPRARGDAVGSGAVGCTVGRCCALPMTPASPDGAYRPTRPAHRPSRAPSARQSAAQQQIHSDRPVIPAARLWLVLVGLLQSGTSAGQACKRQQPPSHEKSWAAAAGLAPGAAHRLFDSQIVLPTSSPVLASAPPLPMGALACSQQADGLAGRLGSRSVLPKGLAGARRLPAAPAPRRRCRAVPAAAALGSRPAEVSNVVTAGIYKLKLLWHAAALMSA